MAKGKSKEVVQKPVVNQLTEEEKEAKAKKEQLEKEKADSEAKANAEKEEKDKADIEAKAKTEKKAVKSEVDHSEKAKKIMKEQNAKEIWRCPETGYWFTRKDYANDQSKKTGKSLEHYKQ